MQNFRSVFFARSNRSPSRGLSIRSPSRDYIRSFFFRTGTRAKADHFGQDFSYASTIAHERHLSLSFYLPPSVGLLEQFFECDPDISARIFASEHQFVRLQEKNVIKIFRFARSRSSIGATNSLGFKEPMRSRFFCSRFCERASIRSPSGNHLHPPFSLAGGEPRRRGDHFWVRFTVELNLEALACHPRTSKERTRAPWNVFFSFFSFFVLLSLFFSLSKAVLPYKHHTCTAYYTSKDLNLKQYRTAFT